MKTIKGKTLSEILEKLKAQGIKNGDVLLTNLKKSKGQILLSFSNIPDKFLLGWDTRIERWIVQ